MFKAEIKRVFHTKAFTAVLAMLAVMLLIDGLYIHISVNDNFSKEIQQFNYVDLTDTEEVNTASNLRAYSIDLYDHLSYITDFWNTLPNQKDKLIQQSNSILFQDSQNQTEIKAELDSVDHLLAYEPKLMNDQVDLNSFSSMQYWPFIWCALGIILFYFIVVEDRENDVLQLYSSTKTSLMKIIVSKMLLICGILLVFCLIKTGLTLLYMSMSGVDIHLPIQYLYGYSQLNTQMSILRYFIILSFSKYLYSILTVSLFAAVYLRCRKISTSFIIGVLFLIVEYLINLFVSTASSMSILKKMNLFTLMNTDTLNEGWFILFGKAYPYCVIEILTAIGITVILLLLSFRWYAGRTGNRRVDSLKRPIKHKHTFVYQFKNFELGNHGILALIIVGTMVFGYAFQFKGVQSNDEIRYREFQKQYFGEINQELLDRVEANKEEIQTASDKLDKMIALEVSQKGQLSDDQIEEMNTLSNLTAHTDDIQKVSSEIQMRIDNGIDTYAVSEGLEYLADKENKTITIVEFLLCLLPVCILSITFLSSIYRKNIYRLYFSTQEGKKKYYIHHLMTAGIEMLILFAMVYGSHYLRIAEYYSLDGLKGSIGGYLGTGGGLSIPLYFILLFFNRFSIALCIVMIGIILAGNRSPVNVLLIVLCITGIVIAVPGISNLLYYQYYDSSILYWIEIIGVWIVNWILFRRMIKQ